MERQPVLDGLIPILAIGAHGTAFEIIEGDLVGGDDTGAGACLDGHVGNGHAGLHGERLDCGACELDRATGATGSSDNATDVEDDVLGGDTFIKLSIDTDEHILCLGLGQGLSGKNVLYLRGADAEGHGAESAMGGRVRVAAYCRTSGESKALLRSDDVNNALPLVSHSKVY